MASIFAIDTDQYESDIRRAFSTRQLAEQYVNAYKVDNALHNHCEIIELTLDKTYAEEQAEEQAQRDKELAQKRMMEPFLFIRDARLIPITVGINLPYNGSAGTRVVFESGPQFFNPFTMLGPSSVYGVDILAQGIVLECAQTWTDLVGFGIHPQRALDGIKTIMWNLRGPAGTGKSRALGKLVSLVRDGWMVVPEHVKENAVPEFTSVYMKNQWDMIVQKAQVGSHPVEKPAYHFGSWAQDIPIK